MAQLNYDQIKEITDIIRHEVKVAVEPIRQDLQKYEKNSTKKLQQLHDYMIVQMDRQKRGTGDKSWQGIFKQALVALVVALGIMGLVIQALIKSGG